MGRDDAERERVVVVTAGAGAGIGGNVVRRFHADGDRVFASDAHAGRLEKIRSELGVEADLLDVRDRKAMGEYLARIEAEQGRIDVLVNCAGANQIKPIVELTDDEWETIVDVNLSATFRAARSVLPGMIERGHGAIVSIASIAAWAPDPGEVAYSTTKTALMGFTRALAREIASTGVRVNAVAPAFVENPFLEKLYGAERIRSIRDAAPLGRGVLPSEVAAAVAWLASDEASYVTGEVLTLAGGQYLRG